MAQGQRRSRVPGAALGKTEDNAGIRNRIKRATDQVMKISEAA